MWFVHCNIVQLNEFFYFLFFLNGCLLVLNLESLDSLAFVLAVVSRVEDLLSCLMEIDLAGTEARLVATFSQQKKKKKKKKKKKERKKERRRRRRRELS